MSRETSTLPAKQRPPDRLRATHGATLLAGGAWLVALIVGGRAALKYEVTPGVASAAPAAWPLSPVASDGTGRPRLLMFVHPKCPCSRASIAQLAGLMAECTTPVDAEVVFIRPAEFAAGWEDTDLWRSASSIPGVSVRVDPGGAEAQRFGAATSGSVLFYGADGQLLFNGGITESRGHLGPSEGRAALGRLLSQSRDPIAQTAVYGCPLFDVNSSNGGGLSCKR